MLLLLSYGALIAVRPALSKPLYQSSRFGYGYMNLTTIESFYQNPCSIAGRLALSKLVYQGNRSNYGSLREF